jgi:cohesin complex subunit SA-1/2
VQIQMDLLTWVGKRLGAYKANGNKRATKRAAQFFRVLIPLLSALPSKEALRVKAHMEQVLSEAKVEVASAKIWDAQRAYEKRLTNAMAKVKGKKTARKAARVTDDEGAGTDGEGYGAGATDDEAPLPVPARPKPRPHRKRRSSLEIDDADDNPENDEVDAPQTPKPTRRSTRTRGNAAAQRKAPADAEEPPAAPSPEVNEDDSVFTTGQKRPRDEDAMDVDETPDVNGGGSPLSPISSRASTPANDAPARRKRVRH